MKKKILFVDDEINILKGLQRSLRPLRDKWEMTFAQGPHHALACLEIEPFDVVVSDMQMPEMEGSRLMEIIQEKYPAIIRIILSGHSDQEMIMNTIKTAHQYLSKPCEKETLINTISRACALRDLLNKPALLELIGGIESMPSRPALYDRIMTDLKSEEVSAQDIGMIIADDIGMTAKILQLVNSSFFGLPRHISSAKDAVILLGIDLIKALVLGVEVFRRFPRKNVDSVAMDAVHDHCIRTGQIVDYIARQMKLDKVKSDTAVIASILHDIGKLILAEYFYDEYREVIQISGSKRIPLFRAEKQVFDVTHAEVGAYLLGLWGLPDTVIEAIAFHHDPLTLQSDAIDMSGLIHIADFLEHLDQLPEELAEDCGLDMAYIRKHGLENRLAGYWQAVNAPNSTS